MHHIGHMHAASQQTAAVPTCMSAALANVLPACQLASVHVCSIVRWISCETTRIGCPEWYAALASVLVRGGRRHEHWTSVNGRCRTWMQTTHVRASIAGRPRCVATPWPRILTLLNASAPLRHLSLCQYTTTTLKVQQLYWQPY